MHASFSFKDREYTILNIHGISFWPKIDGPERIKQSEIISDFLKNINHSKIVCGDLNLQSNTKSLDMLRVGMQDLIKDFGITTTRSSLHPFNDEEGRLSDYVFVSPDIEVEDFKVPQEAKVSDHLPLILNFS